MLASFLIMLREGLEAALITGIIASYLRQANQAEWLPAIWIGIFLAVAASLFVGAALQLASAEFPQKAQELFEAIVGFVAVAMLVSMVFWMRRAARSIKSELYEGVNAALTNGQGTAMALVAMTFLAVGREGLESVFFLLAVFQQSTGPAVPLGALLGILVSVAVGYGVYAGGIRLDLRRFFRITGVLVLVVAAGLLASAFRHLHEAGIWNLLQAQAWDLSHVLPVTSPLGAVLSGIFNYQDAPTVGEVAFYVAFLAVTLFLFLRPAEPQRAVALPAGSKNG